MADKDQKKKQQNTRSAIVSAICSCVILAALAFMLLGIEESSRIAQVLNYSLNTIYAYRNRTKARAINRDSFEDDVMKIQAEY